MTPEVSIKLIARYVLTPLVAAVFNTLPRLTCDKLLPKDNFPLDQVLPVIPTPPDTIRAPVVVFVDIFVFDINN